MAAPPEVSVSVLETCTAAPPPNPAPELSLPLTFSDMMWLLIPSQIQRLIFYDSPISTSHFLNSTVPKLKTSLSAALRHFPSLSGNLIIPPLPTRPEIQYLDGDSVSFIIAEAANSSDYDHLVGHQPRDCRGFYALLPRLPRSSNVSGTITVPLLALQVTLFPGKGICIGLTNHHVGGDGSSLYAFVRAWTVLSRLGEDATLSAERLPFYDRSVMSRHTKELDDVFWKFVRGGLEKGQVDFDKPQELPDSTDRVRGSFGFSPDDIKRLKSYIKQLNSSLTHLSTFTVVCGYVWICLVRAGNETNPADGDGAEYFGSVADCRGRTDPPIPGNYFGNCLSYFLAEAKNKEMSKGLEYLPTAAEKIGESIAKRMKDKDGVFKNLGEVFGEVTGIDMSRALSVAGSPRQNYYEMDFGWGKPRKFEFVSIDTSGAMSLGGSRVEGGVEVGLSMAKKKMEAFVTIFNEGLQAL